MDDQKSSVRVRARQAGHDSRSLVTSGKTATSSNPLKLALISLTFLIFTWVASPAAALTVDEKYVSLASHFEYLQDPSGELTLEDILQHPSRFVFASSENQKPSESYAPVWLKLNLEFTEATRELDYVLFLRAPRLFNIRIYRRDHNGVYYERITGEDLPVSTREIDDYHFGFNIKPEEEQSTIYMRVVGGLGVNNLTWYLIEESTYEAEHNLHHLLVTAGLGGIVSLLGFYILAAAIIQKREYVYYCAYVMGATFAILILEGVASYHLWPNHPWLNSRILPATNLFTASMRLLVIVTLLNMAQHSPRWNQASRGIVSLLILGIPVVSAFGIKVIPDWSTTALWAVGILFGFSVCLRGVILRIPLAWPLFLTLLVPMLGAFFQAYISVSGREDNLLMSHSALLSFGAHVLLFAFVLGTRIMQINENNQKELEKAIESADASNEAKSVFLASMSHEIRTPMNGVVGMVDLLQRTKLDRNQSQLVRTINDSAFTLLGLIDDILDFSKVEAGKIDLERLPMSMEYILNASGDTLLQLAVKKDIDLLTFCEPNLPDYYGDPVRVRQILYNLAGNAIKFTNSNATQRGQIFISIERSQPKVPGSPVVIKVRDNGIGISEEAQSLLFKPFTQAESSTTREFGGTGLGLSICKRIVGLMDGEIRVESKLKFGSEFSITLPLEEAPRIEEPVDFNLQGVPVMFPEGEAELGRYLTTYLAGAGAAVIKYHDSALDELSLHPFKGVDVIPVVAFNVDNIGQYLQTLQDRMLARLPEPTTINLIVLNYGRRRAPRLGDKGVFEIDYTGLKRAGFLEAVSKAANCWTKANETHSQVTSVSDQQAFQHLQGTVEDDASVLVAEDNSVNQKVIQRQLEVLGLGADIADDGEQAFSMWSENRQQYKILLTDCHMPNMDGYQLATKIREHEGNDERLPIIAITADAITGTRQTCLDAGMDDYLSKPIQVDALKEKLLSWLPSQRESSSENPAETIEESVDDSPETQTTPDEPSNEQVIDKTALPELLGSDEPELLAEFYHEFLASALPTAEEIEEAVNQDRHKEVSSLAHKLKSAAASVGATQIYECCLQMEQSGKNGDGAVLREYQRALASHVEEVKDWILAYYPPQASKVG